MPLANAYGGKMYIGTTLISGFTTEPKTPAELTLSAGQSVWGWWDASTWVSGDGLFLKPVSPGGNRWLFNSAISTTTINTVQAISLTNNHAYLVGPSTTTPVTTTIASKAPADAPAISWEIFAVGKFAGMGTIFSQSISNTTTLRQTQLFRNTAAVDVGGYLTDSYNRGIGASVLDNKDLNPNGDSTTIAYMLLDNTPLAGSNPKVDLGSGANVARRGNLSGVFAALEASPYIRIGARGGGSNAVPAFFFTDPVACISELVIFSHSAGTAALSAANRLSLRRYLASKWGYAEASP